MGGRDVATKRERREQARRERAALQRKIARRRRSRRWGAITTAVLVVALVGSIVLTHRSASPAQASSSGALPGLQTGSAPWVPEYVYLRQRLQALGLPAQSSMSAVVHNHDLLQIYVNGSPVQVPALIGIDQTAGYLTSLHTHDASGIIHVESPEARSFTLGQFFDVWGVRLTSTCIGGYCDSGSSTLRAFVNGSPFTGDPSTIPLTSHEDIVLAYGTGAQLPKPIPNRYSTSISSTCAPSC